MRWLISLLAVWLVSCGPKKVAPVATERGTPEGPKATGMIATTGGSLSSADGQLTIEIPAGALSAATEIGIEPLTRTVDARVAVGRPYRLTPEGVTFLKPVKLIFKYTPKQVVGSSPPALTVAFQDAKGVWRPTAQTRVDEAAGTFSQEVDHFSDWLGVLAWRLDPYEGTVFLNKSKDVSLLFCIVQDADTDLFVDPHCLDRDLGDQTATIHGWAVNGISKGDATVGTVAQGHGTGASYRAPGMVPPRNPVAVSVDFDRGKGRNLAVGNFTVSGEGWRGHVTYTLTGSKTVDEPTSTGLTRKVYRVNGSGNLTLEAAGTLGFPRVAAVTASYSYSYTETTNLAYTAGGCNHTLSQVRTTSMSGESSTGATFALVDEAPGSPVQMTLGLPTGPISGPSKLDATGTSTGAPTCMSPNDTHTSSVEEGAFPDDMTSFSSMLIEGNALYGMHRFTVGDLPPREYEVTFDLMK